MELWETRTILKNYSELHAVVNVADVLGTVSSLVVFRNEALVGSIGEVVEILKVWHILRS